MKIYIASSWKHRYAVEMLTSYLRTLEHTVLSFVENCNEEGNPNFSFDEWLRTDKAVQSFEYDTTSAMNCDLVIYIGPSGKDAAAECGMAFARNIPIIGLWAKGEDFGLMRKMMTYWVTDLSGVKTTVNKIMNKNHLPYEGKI